jgi:hypothetical protein
MSADFIARVKAGLATLRDRDPEGNLVFGATAHRYELGDPLSEEELHGFEEDFGVSLFRTPIEPFYALSETAGPVPFTVYLDWAR